MELGAQGSKKIGDAAPVAWTLRLTVPLKRRIAIEATADVQKSYVNEDVGGARTSATEFSVHWRQTVFTSGRVRIFGLLGVGRNREERSYELIGPPLTFVVSQFVAHVGPAVQVELAPWLALRGDLRGTIGNNGRSSGVRGMVGAVIPIGSRASDPPAESTRPQTGWQRVKPGREVWVTTNTGSLVHGDIAAISDNSLIIREASREVTIRLDDVRRVEVRDSKKNGFLIGAAFGAVGGGLLGNDFTSNCGSDCGDDDDERALRQFATVVGAVGGGLVGGLLGLMVDGLIPGRQTVFQGGTTIVTPVITPTKKAVDVAIRWR